MVLKKKRSRKRLRGERAKEWRQYQHIRRRLGLRTIGQPREGSGGRTWMNRRSRRNTLRRRNISLEILTPQRRLAASNPGVSPREVGKWRHGPCNYSIRET